MEPRKLWNPVGMSSIGRCGLVGLLMASSLAEEGRSSVSF